MRLPDEENLKIGSLSRLFDNTSNCYKFFWFLAILRLLDRTHSCFTFNALIHEMIADAWYMVSEYHLRLGPTGVTDNLEEAVKYIFRTYGFTSSERRENIIAFLENTDDRKIREYKAELTRNVPYRLQVPFYDDIRISRKTWYGPKEALASEINCQKRLMYYFGGVSGLDTVIKVDDAWTGYLCRHKEILTGWTQLKLVQYLQNRNPSVPGITEKLEPPAARDLERVRKYWKCIIQADPSIREIYGNAVLAKENISIDHFVPWQYVAHDELWNLHPTLKSFNSRKSNALPSWERYFLPFGKLEYRAYELQNRNPLVSEEFQKTALYHLNNQEIRGRLYEDGLSEAAFIERLEKVVRPVYDAAHTLGFREWTNDGLGDRQADLCGRSRSV